MKQTNITSLHHRIATSILIVLVSVLGVSCLGDDDSDTKKWKQDNEAAFEKIANNTEEYKELKPEDGGPTGIYYKDLNEGVSVEKGTVYPLQTSKVRVRYQGAYYDGTIFDKGNYGGNSLVDFDLTSVVRGFSYALQNMVVGDKWEIWIPYWLGYGVEGYRNYYGVVLVKGYSALVFTVELVEIVMYP